MDLKTRIEIIELYYSNRKSSADTLRAYKTMHDLWKDPFKVRTIQRLVQRFQETGSVSDKPKSGRPSLEEEAMVATRAAVSCWFSTDTDTDTDTGLEHDTDTDTDTDRISKLHDTDTGQK